MPPFCFCSKGAVVSAGDDNPEIGVPHFAKGRTFNEGGLKSPSSSEVIIGTYALFAAKASPGPGR